MEETARTEQEIRDKITQNLQVAGHGVESVTPPTENPLEIAAELADLGGKTEGNAPSRNFLERLKARIKRETGRQEEILDKAA